MKRLEIVIDTNVLVAALRSNRGASFRLLQNIDSDLLELNLSVPLFLEYEDAAKRLVKKGGLSISDIDNILSYLAFVAKPRNIYYLWRPFLKDPKDDMVLELAVAVQCKYIVTFNQRDFAGIEQFGISLISPKDLLRLMGDIL
jgi:putative PIN family toxin of toxin-antitoxin system